MINKPAPKKSRPTSAGADRKTRASFILEAALEEHREEIIRHIMAEGGAS
jgi:hypothetical protein